MTAIVLFTSLIVFLVLNVPIAFAIGLASVVGFLYSGIDLMAVAQRMLGSVNSFTLLAIPFFMLAGSLMQTGGMSRRLVRFASAIVSTLPGGLGHVQVLASCFFAALSGSSPATTAAIGSALIPEMKKRGYPPEFAASVQAVSGTIGTIIPPSIPMVVYGVVAGQSIGELFAAGFIPGLLCGFSLMVVVYWKSKKHGYGNPQVFSAKELWDSFKDAFWALMVPVIILGGIYSGMFTPTEAGAVAAVYGLIVGVFVYKELNFSNIIHVFSTAAANTAMVLLIIASSSVFSWLMTIKGVAAMVGAWFASVSGSPAGFLALFILLGLFLGCFMETVSIILIVTPVLFPVAKQFGIDPIHFGIIMTMTLSLGMATPPVGENL
ncbi:MAG: TRAP transporter large permease subunit, partial [Synergistales bacterium]|nr:TRAP transporter large permease subunit [Synergistales bacterium]